MDHRLPVRPDQAGQLPSLLEAERTELGTSAPTVDRTASPLAARRAFPPQVCAKIHIRNAELVALTASDLPSSRQLLLSR